MRNEHLHCQVNNSINKMWDIIKIQQCLHYGEYVK